MASSLHSSSSTSPSQGCVDPIDIDSFIKYEAISYQSPSISPSISRSHSAVRPSSSVNPNNTLLPPDSTQTFSGPSHQYGNYKQQTGLPAGALSTTHSVNQPINTGFFRSGSAYNTGFNMGSREEVVDFNDLALNNNEMDFDLQTMLDTNEGPAFIDPSVLGGSDDIGADLDLVQSQPSSVGRLYPGAHQQQAALAKQQQQQARSAVPQQQRPSRSQVSDPIAEKKISQLLKSMRQSSVATSNSDDDALNNGNLAVHRIKKDEEDMDEDERLLASEEGKKLSSKERRQLRNKVSARAFRSRRKEYIGQLEEEINAKTNEASDLRMQNKALMLENTRLTDLTRMLLSSPAFSTFLDEMSSESIPMPQQAPQPQQQPEPAQSSVHKDANPFTVAQQQANNPGHNGPQVGMTLIPDNAIDLFSPMTGVGNVYNNWNTNQPQVFSVMELPEGPSFDEIDTGVLSGKSDSSTPILSSIESKVEAPVVERASIPEETGSTAATSTDDEEVEWDESDPSFALFIDAPKSTINDNVDHVQVFGAIPLEKAFARIELVAESNDETVASDVSTAAMDRFERICSSADAIIARMDRITGHL